MPKILMVGARDQERFIGDTSTVAVVGNIAGRMGVKGDDEKCGLKGQVLPLWAPRVVWLGGCMVLPHAWRLC